MPKTKDKDKEAVAAASAAAAAVAETRAKRLEPHTGQCGASGCSCAGWLTGRRDYVGWEMCGEDGCSHTKDSHERVDNA